MTIEKLARALYEPLVIDENPCDVTQWDRLPEEAREVWRSCARSILPLIAAELAGVARDPKLIDQVSRGLAAGWRGNPNMSGDDRDFMHPSMRRRHDEKSADACEFIALAIEAHARKMGEA